MNLYNVSFHENWQDAFGYLRFVAETIFELRNQSAEKQTKDVVDQIKSYITENLGADTSLHRLAEQGDYDPAVHQRAEADRGKTAFVGDGFIGQGDCTAAWLCESGLFRTVFPK